MIINCGDNGRHCTRSVESKKMVIYVNPVLETGRTMESCDTVAVNPPIRGKTLIKYVDYSSWRNDVTRCCIFGKLV